MGVDLPVLLATAPRRRRGLRGRRAGRWAGALLGLVVSQSPAAAFAAEEGAAPQAGAASPPQPAPPAEAPPALTVALDHVGTGACDDRALLERAIRRRLPGVHLSDAASDVPTLTVRFTEGPGSVSADVRLTPAQSPHASEPPDGVVGSDGEAAARTVAGARCDEVSEAAALVAVVLLTRPRPAAPSDTHVEPEPEPEPEPPVAPEPARPRGAWTLGGAAVLVVGLTPGAAVGAEATVEWARSTAAGQGAGWAPAARAGFRMVGQPATSWAGAEVAFGVVGGFVELCPVAVASGRRWALRPCAAATAARVAARRLDDAEEQAHAWGALGLGAELAVAPVPWLSVQLGAGADVGLASVRVYVGEALAHESSPIVGRATAGLGIRIP